MVYFDVKKSKHNKDRNFQELILVPNTIMKLLNAVRVASKCEPVHQAVIILHGLGDSGSGWSFMADYLQKDPAFSHTRFIFPNAPIINIEINGNYPMPGWFNIHSCEIWENFDYKGYSKSLKVAEKFIYEQIEDGIKPENIIIGGFSQGASITLGAALTLPMKIGGFLALSGFCSFDNSLISIKKNFNLDTPIFHGHGDSDMIIPLKEGKRTHSELTSKLGLTSYQFNVYQGLDHGTSLEELNDVIKFMKNVFAI